MSTPLGVSRRRRSYGDYWKGLLPELGFLAPLLIVIITVFSLLMSIFATGVGLIALIVGIPIIVISQFLARGAGIFELWRLQAARFPKIVPPKWDARAPGPGASPWLKLIAPLVDGHYWLYLLHGLVVNPIVGLVTWIITAAWITIGISGTLSVLSIGSFPDRSELPVIFGPWAARAELLFGNPAFAMIVFTLIGLIFLATLPFITHALVWVHHSIAKGMLAAFRSEELREQMADLSASRTAAVAAEGTALRRLERDIHDGPQQRLVRLQMDLAAAERQLDKDPDAARALIGEARQQSREALEELRALSRGFAPPILLDRGLVAALESLAVRSPLPIHVESTLPPGFVIPADAERNAYFIAAEALTNVAKHADAHNAWVRIEHHAAPQWGAEWLDVVVTDDGRGGAAAMSGHGLAGIAERLHGLGGTVQVQSPVGGPTHVIARVPLRGVLPAPLAAIPASGRLN